MTDDTTTSTDLTTPADDRTAVAPGWVRLDGEAATAVGLPGGTVAPAGEHEVTERAWRDVSDAGRQAVMRLLDDPAEQRRLLGGHWLHRGRNRDEVDYETGSASFVAQRRRLYAQAAEIEDPDERAARVAELRERYSELESGRPVRVIQSQITGRVFDRGDAA